MKVCGIVVARLQGAKLGTSPVKRFQVNVGTIPGAPSPPGSIQLPGGGKAHRRLMLPGWDGGPVLVRGRESRPHGEGVQQVRSDDADRGGRW